MFFFQHVVNLHMIAHSGALLAPETHSSSRVKSLSDAKDLEENRTVCNRGKRLT